MPALPKFRILGQQEQPWANMKLGASNLTVGHDGCDLCSVITLSNYFYGGMKWTPDQVCTDASLFTPDGLVIYDALCAKLGNLKYTGATVGENDVAIKAAIQGTNTGVVLWVNNKSHFVLGWSIPIFGNDFNVADSWYQKVDQAKGTWKNIDGGRFFIDA